MLMLMLMVVMYLKNYEKNIRHLDLQKYVTKQKRMNVKDSLVYPDAPW